MITGTLIDLLGQESSELSPLLRRSLQWLSEQKEPMDDGEYDIQGKEIYAIGNTVLTYPREEGVFESHKRYIDVHYCMTGGEIIEYAPVHTLQAKTAYDTEKDFILYDSPAKAQPLHMIPGSVAIFFPDDAHMPKLFDGQNNKVHKIVVKVLFS